MEPKDILAKTAKHLTSAYGARTLYDVKYNPFINLTTGLWRINNTYSSSLQLDNLSTRALFKVLTLC